MRVGGIDVGGMRKGCHLVVLDGRNVILSTRSTDPEVLVQHCVHYQVGIVGVDAPCRWSVEGRGRKAERELARERIFCFSTPTAERATANPNGFYGWMLNGQRIYEALSDQYPLMVDGKYAGMPASFETFPHAIVCALLGKHVASAKQKRLQRRALLEDVGIETTTLGSIDALDAALCALAARLLLLSEARTFGDAASGHIVIPKVDLAGVQKLFDVT
ncbi:DUF429 domain-containing protein [Cupriavidus pauculus]|uniref:DUF429 domain-containing protein n=1 Tax=Cupriavidus pauculus TaxID=82633 RepID=A0A2N5CDR6_9BURK|nr:DUF429 domain-containing protein [Cupriavidus pauculus]PLQ00356.1 DUF429 domain-containing protein [Cupriavidus pauculus]